MAVSTHSIPRRRPVARRRGRALRPALRPPVPAVGPDVVATVSAQRGGGPQDSALYHCACGCRFHALVSASVPCPACDASQTW